MADTSRSDTHPLARLHVSLTEIERRTGGYVKRPNLSVVLNRHRHRLGVDANLAIKRAFPEYAFEEALNWKWRRLRPFKSQESRAVAARSRRPRPSTR